MSFLRLLAGATLVAATIAGPASAQDAAQKAAVKARQAHMGLYAFNLGILGGMAKGAIAYDADIASTAAADLAALTTFSQMNYWPMGTSTDDMEGTRALAKAWEPANMSDIGAKSKALAEAAAAMSSTAGSGLEAVQAAIGPVGKACGACHKAYRQPKE